MDNGQEPRITSGAAWRKPWEEGELVQFPESGNVARLRPVGLVDLWQLGKIPDHLTAIVVELLTAQQLSPERAIEKAAENLKGITDLYVIVCRAAFISPKVVDDPAGDDEIAFHHIIQADREFLLAWCNAPQAALRSFRPKQALDVATLRDGGKVRAEAEPDPERSG